MMDEFKKFRLTSEQLKAIQSFLASDLEEVRATLVSLEQIAQTQTGDQKDVQARLDATINGIMSKARQLEAVVDHRLALDKTKEIFRKIVGFSAYKSKFIQRAFEKPLGYPGDYVLLENIYNNVPISEGFGRYWDIYFLNDRLGEAVRERKDIMVRYLADFVKTSYANEKKPLKLLNLACGSSREIKELFNRLDQEHISILDITCLDQDEQALRYSKQALGKYKGNVSFVKEDIIRLSKRREGKSLAGQNMVYSIGLADYLPDRVLTAFMTACFSLLDKGGVFFLAHKDNTAYVPTVQDWFCNWTFYPRQEEQLRKMISSFIDAQTRVSAFRGINDIIYFFVITK